MKNILMSTAALAGLALVAAAPARADEPALQLGLGGYISGYAVYTDQDNGPLDTNTGTAVLDWQTQPLGRVSLSRKAF